MSTATSSTSTIPILSTASPTLTTMMPPISTGSPPLSTLSPVLSSSQPVLTTAQPVVTTTSTTTRTTTIPVTISLPVIVVIATDMKNGTAVQKEVLETILETLDNTTEIHKEIAEIVTFLDDLTIALDNIISLAGMRKRRSISSNCKNVENLISSYVIALTDINTILEKLNSVEATGIQTIDDYIATAKEVFKETRTELLDGKRNLDQYHAQQCVSTTPIPSTTTTSSVAAIIAAAEEVKTDTENKINELKTILASLDPDLDSDLIGSLNTLLSFFNLLNGNLDEIASVSETNQRKKRGEMGELQKKKLHH